RFSGATPRSAVVGQALRYAATATDSDRDSLTYDLVVEPAGMVVDPATGLIVWTPGADQAGDQPVILPAPDGRGRVDPASFQVTVPSFNTAPVITSHPAGPASVGYPYQYLVRAQDADVDAISFRLADPPTGMIIDAVTGLLTWTPTADQVGSRHVAIVADD